MLMLVVMLTVGVRHTGGVTCYTCKVGEVNTNGTCQEEHKAEYCQGQEWCFKQWRGTPDDFRGEGAPTCLA